MREFVSLEPQGTGSGAVADPAMQTWEPDIPQQPTLQSGSVGRGTKMSVGHGSRLGVTKRFPTRNPSLIQHFEVQESTGTNRSRVSRDTFPKAMPKPDNVLPTEVQYWKTW